MLHKHVTLKTDLSFPLFKFPPSLNNAVLWHCNSHRPCFSIPSCIHSHRIHLLNPVGEKSSPEACHRVTSSTFQYHWSPTDLFQIQCCQNDAPLLHDLDKMGKEEIVVKQHLKVCPQFRALRAHTGVSSPSFWAQ